MKPCTQAARQANTANRVLRGDDFILRDDIHVGTSRLQAVAETGNCGTRESSGTCDRITEGILQGARVCFFSVRSMIPKLTGRCLFLICTGSFP